MIKAVNLTIEYGRPIFKNLSFTLGNKEKVGLVGLNGSGKTTLLKILAGVEQSDLGTIEMVGEKIGYLPQEYSFPEGTLVGEILESCVKDHKTELYKVNKVLNLLEFKDVDWYQDVNTLSYGQKMKLYLTTLLAKEPTILLMDEPTNHLDIFGILWLENFIKNFEGICIIVSHDRAFLNAITNKVFEIDEHVLNVFDGNYDDYLEQKEALIERRATQFHLQEKKREKFEDMIDRAKKGMAGAQLAKALKAARSRMDREVTKKEINEYKESKINNLNLAGSVHKAKTVLKVKNLSFGYDAQNLLLENASLEIYGKEKVWFYGLNGIGKSTFIKLIVNELKPLSGEIKIGNDLKYIYFSQDQSHLPLNETLENYFLDNTDVSVNQSFGILERFLFTKDMRKTLIKRLSPGQRARLSFAVFSQKTYDFMILDEPTNHLDIRSKEVIEEALRNYQGTVLLISHDRYFVESLGINRAITLENRKIVEKICIKIE